jgi:hypothetical protein
MECDHEKKLGCCGRCECKCKCYQCQYCEQRAPQRKWKKDVCPNCGGVYDCILAQEGDD